MGRQKKLIIANAGGYWGDDPTALKRQIEGGDVDYVTMDFLAEVTMSIMQKQRSRDQSLGYARDFLTMLEEVLPLALKKKTKIITNAGGVNPEACAKAIADLADRLGLHPKIAVVFGDDILHSIDELQAQGAAFSNMETGENFSDVKDRLESANVYFGAEPVVEALRWDPDIVITGRVTDTGITVAPMIHEFAWDKHDWDKIAQGIVASHLIECGSQVTGGNFTDWHLVKSFQNIGYPIIEVEADGSFVLTKHKGTGGLVSVDTVREQLFYEMGNPKAYITPDVVADFTSICLEADGEDRVKVFGVKGFQPTPLYKVSMAYRDGYKSQGAIVISGPNARAKAEAFAEVFWHRLGEAFEEQQTEYFGWNACHRSLGHRSDGNEIMLRLGVRSKDKNSLQRFGKLIPSLILSGPPGVAVLGGVPKPQDVVTYWPALILKSLVKPKITLYDQGFSAVRIVEGVVSGDFVLEEADDTQVATQATHSIESLMDEAADASFPRLMEICLGRSGDKGDMANIGILARSQRAFEYLDQELSAQRVKNYFQEICFGKVIRYRIPGLLGFNFLLENSLGGGGTKTLRTDAQGKTFSQALLRQRMAIPSQLMEEIAKGINIDGIRKH
jgi:hypothetical protein